MKNKLILEEKQGSTMYNPLIKVETDEETYIIYTKNEVSKSDNVICYAGIYKYEDGKQVIEAIEDEHTLEFLDSILMQMENAINKKEGSE